MNRTEAEALVKPHIFIHNGYSVVHPLMALNLLGKERYAKLNKDPIKGKTYLTYHYYWNIVDYLLLSVEPAMSILDQISSIQADLQKDKKEPNKAPLIALFDKLKVIKGKVTARITDRELNRRKAYEYNVRVQYLHNDGTEQPSQIQITYYWWIFTYRTIHIASSRSKNCEHLFNIFLYPNGNDQNNRKAEEIEYIVAEILARDNFVAETNHGRYYV